MRKVLPLDHPDAPKFWMYETGGVLRPAVEAYLRGEALDPEQVGLIRAYLWQWVRSPVWDGSGELEALRLRVAAISSKADIDAALEAALDLGMDPL